ncbi:MAG: SDR family NAD(P)-dependent oxidoreductase [Geminicoccaceae bacterium]
MSEPDMHTHSIDEHDQFAGKVAVITGGFPQLGEATARLLAQRGAAGMVLGGSSVERGHAVAAIMSAAGCTTHFVPADLTNLDDCAAVLTTAEHAFGRIDLLINNLGVVDSSTIWDTSPEAFDHIFALNVRAPFFFMQGAAHIMRRSRIPGVLINIISMSGQSDPPLIPAYHASEGALASMIQSAASAFAEHEISVLGLNIGWYGAIDDTESRSSDDVGPWNSLDPGRAPAPQQVAGAIALLASGNFGTASGSIVHLDPGDRDAS